MKPAPATVDEYMDAIKDPEFREVLMDLRKVILDELPDAEEKISYGMPTYKLRRSICHFAAFSNHCSFFPGGVVQDYAEELEGYKISKGTVQFTPDRPLRFDLVRKMIRRNRQADLETKKTK